MPREVDLPNPIRELLGILERLFREAGNDERNRAVPIDALPIHLQDDDVLAGAERRRLAVRVAWYEGTPFSSDKGTIIIGSPARWVSPRDLTHRPEPTHVLISRTGLERLSEWRLAQKAPTGGQGAADKRGAEGNGGSSPNEPEDSGPRSEPNNPQLAKRKKLKPCWEAAVGVYDWAMSEIPGADTMTVSELFEAIQNHPDMKADFLEKLPDNAETFGRYLREGGVKRYDKTGRRTTRSVRHRAEM